MIKQQIIPITGLPEAIHTILFIFVIPILGSIITVYLFPKIFSPLFLKIKSIFYKRYEDGYIENTIKARTPKFFLRRAIYTILLTLGILSFIIPNIDESAMLFMSTSAYQEFKELGIYPGYNVTLLNTLVGILIPFINGIWAIGWSLEDAGLMHYRVEDQREGKEAYEIEPTHVKYNSFIRGYAGISSILFIIQAAASYFSVMAISPERGSDLYVVFTLPLTILGQFILIYIVYTRIGINNDKLRKGLSVLKQVKKQDLIES